MGPGQRAGGPDDRIGTAARSLIRETRRWLTRPADPALGEPADLGPEPARAEALLWAVDVSGRRAVEALPTPALRHLGPALAAMRTAGFGRLAGLIQTLSPCLPWTPLYLEGDWSAPFRTEIAAGEVAGPSGLIPSDRVAFGLWLQGPGTVYPPHGHPAVEMYLVLSGQTTWRIGPDTGFIARPGRRIVHDSDVAHAMTTGSEPLCALYLGRGDLAGAIWEVDDPADPRGRRRPVVRSGAP